MSDPELGVIRCYYCKSISELLTPNKEQKDLWLDYEKDYAGQNPKYCAKCLGRCDKKIENRKRKREKYRTRKATVDTKTLSYDNEFSLEPSQSSSESDVLTIDLNQNNTQISSNAHLSPSTVMHRPAESETDSEGSYLKLVLPNESKYSELSRSDGSNDSQLSQSSAKKRPASSDDDESNSSIPENVPVPANKKNKPNSQNTDDTAMSPLNFDGESDVAVDNAAFDVDDDVMLVPVQAPSGSIQGQQQMAAHGTAALPDDDDGDGNSSSSSANSISSRRNPTPPQSNRRSNASQSSNNRSHDNDLAANNSISGLAPSQKHLRYRTQPPARAFTPEEQERLHDRNARNQILEEQPNIKHNSLQINIYGNNFYNRKLKVKHKNMDTSNPFSNLFESDKSLQTMGTEQPRKTLNGMDQKINGLIENIFFITINRTPQKSKQRVFMEDLSSAYPESTLMNIELLEQALFERILMRNPRDYLIPNNTQNDDTEAVAEDKVILYLYYCYERLMKWTRHDNSNVTIQNECEKIKQLILRNASTAMKQPELFEGQSLSGQWLDIFQNYFDEYECKCNFLSHVIAEVYTDADASLYDQSIRQTFGQIFDKCLKSVSNASLITVEKWVIFTMRAFVSDKTNPKMAELLLDYTTPKPRPNGSIDGIQYAETLLGGLLSLSILPKKHNGPYEYYENIADSESSTLTSSLWNYLTLHLDEIHGIVKGFLIVGGDIRNKMLEWIGSCLHSNAARGQLWNAHNPLGMMGATKTVPDSFMIGLCGVLLRLCKPLLRPTYKILDVDPTYFAVSEGDRAAKGVHMHAVDKETCLIPFPEENQPRQTSSSYNFVTEVFYMTHRAIDLGYRVCIEKFFQLNRDMSRIQSVYRDIQAQAQGGEMMQNMMDALTTQMPKFLCLQKLIIEPNNDQMLLRFYEGTALLLVRCASRIPDPQNPENEMNPTEITLPIQSPAPKCLSSIPEFVLENIVGYLTFIRHFDSQAIDTDIDVQNNIFTLILVFMGDVSRARNPHLRARLSEGLESFLPKKCNALSCSSKAHLFTQHPHRLEIVSNLLSVFVGIEMTGQSVQFEQKFNYRRPMYAIMEYIWKIEEQRECFKRLATHALEHMEAVDPPLFLRFVNLLINDAIFLLDESLSNLKQIRQLQTAQDNGEWNSLPANEREQNLANLQQTGMMARFDNILGRDTINLLKLLTSEVPEIFCHASMVDRITAMLNYFLLNLTGPNKGSFKVKDKKEYDFDPAKTVLEICRIYINLQNFNGFCLAVSQDGRSYSPQLFEYAEQVLVRIGGGQLVGEISDFAIKVSQLEREEKVNQEALVDAPEEFLDPITASLMSEPVILPSSRVTVDRTTIARHLLSDQSDPFNRSPLTMDQVKTDVELKAKIVAWIQERKNEYKLST